MIALPIISQRNYIINNDTLVCYTHNENRTIALIMLEGEKDSILLNDCNQYTKTIRSQFLNSTNNFDSLKTLTGICINDNVTLHNQITIKDKQIKLKNTIIYSSIGINIVVLLIILL